jgi:hypothetical protein
MRFVFDLEQTWRLAAVVGLAAGCGARGGSAEQAPELIATSNQAVTGSYDWLQFNGDARHSGDNTIETTITAQKGTAGYVGNLTKLFTVTLPRGVSFPNPVRADSAVSVLTNVTTSSGVHDLAFLLTAEGRILALDAHTGATVWSALNNPQKLSAGNPNGSGKDVQATPAIDPGRNFVYTVGLDGLIHKYNVGSGVEVTGGGWPEVLSKKFTLERAAPALTIATAKSGTTYLYAGTGGYGDGGDYQGHIVAINLATGAQQIFNAVCSDQTVHFVTGGSPDCTGTRATQSAVWARSGVSYDSDNDKIFFATGNGLFSSTAHRWGDTILALHPDGTGSGVNGFPIDSYTPSSFANLDSNDLDLGASAPLILPKGTTKFPHLAVQVGKDSTLRIVNLDNLSGTGAAGNVGGELFSMPLPTGGEVQNALASWVDSAGTVWIYAVSPTNGVAGNNNGINALTLAQDASGNPSLKTMWTNAGSGGSSPLVANGIVYWATSNDMHALDPTTGAVLWSSSSIGPIHWEEPVVVNGILYITDDAGQLNAFSPGTPPPPFPVQINFQPATAPAFSGYLKDTGLVFANRGNGQTYGWSVDISSTARQRNSTLSPDERYDTLVQPQHLGLNATWDLAVPNGNYSVRVVAGDPSFIDSKYVFAVEGTVVINGTPTASTHWFDNTVTVSVTDGTLTLTNAAGSVNNKVDFLVVNKL